MEPKLLSTWCLVLMLFTGTPFTAPLTATSHPTHPDEFTLRKNEADPLFSATLNAPVFLCLNKFTTP